MLCRESLLVFKLIARPTLPVEIVLHSKTVGGETVDIGTGGTVDIVAGGTVDIGTGDKIEKSHFEDRGTIDNDEEVEEELVNGSGTATEPVVDEVITITDDSQDMITHDQTQSEACSGSPIVTIDLKEPTVKSPSPRKEEDKNQSIVSIPGSSNYVTANDSTLAGSQILSPESDYMEILDELS